MSLATKGLKLNKVDNIDFYIMIAQRQFALWCIKLYTDINSTNGCLPSLFTDNRHQRILLSIP